MDRKTLGRARRAVAYMLRGAQQVGSVASGSWFKVVGGGDLSGADTRNAVAAAKAFARKYPAQLSACAEGMIYLGAPTYKSATEAIRALGQVVEATAHPENFVVSVNEVNDISFQRCPTVDQLQRRFETMLQAAELGVRLTRNYRLPSKAAQAKARAEAEDYAI
jgi:hypothetical protein